MEFLGMRKTTAADDAGNWKVTLDPLAVSSGSRTMTITASSGVDVLVRAATSQGIRRPDRDHREGIPPHSPTPIPALTASAAAGAEVNSI